MDSYTLRVTDEIKRWGVRVARPIDTLYLGGGTPSLLGGENIKKIISAVDRAFGIKKGAEITLECNPADELEDTFLAAAAAGVNRLSVGVQSGIGRELSVLGRRHGVEDAEKTVLAARRAGIENISLDLMLGLPESTLDTVLESINYICSLQPQHISVYMLKIEEGTPFYKNRPPLPSEDETAEQYLFVCRELKKRGYLQYEISNFCKKGYESRHNKNYWLLGEYLGIGPSAHSFLDGRRFYYPRDTRAFLEGTAVIPDGTGGELSEFIMLRLRLGEGLLWEEAAARGADVDKMKKTAERLKDTGLLEVCDKGIKLTERGFLLSNAVIGEFI